MPDVSPAPCLGNFEQHCVNSVGIAPELAAFARTWSNSLRNWPIRVGPFRSESNHASKLATTSGNQFGPSCIHPWDKPLGKHTFRPKLAQNRANADRCLPRLASDLGRPRPTSDKFGGPGAAKFGPSWTCAQGGLTLFGMFSVKHAAKRRDTRRARTHVRKTPTKLHQSAQTGRALQNCSRNAPPFRVIAGRLARPGKRILPRFGRFGQLRGCLSDICSGQRPRARLACLRHGSVVCRGSETSFGRHANSQRWAAYLDRLWPPMSKYLGRSGRRKELPWDA